MCLVRNVRCDIVVTVAPPRSDPCSEAVSEEEEEEEEEEEQEEGEEEEDDRW
jgi:ribosomal protein L12E/L44/L45/RPP1/RPP2